MDNIEINTLCDGVESCHIRTDKFKTTRISINLFVEADEKSVSANALLSGLLTNSCEKYPDYTSLNAKLNELYGATLYGDVVKFGDMQLVKFVIAVLDDKYTLNGEKISSEACDLLLSMLFNPPLENGLFKKSDFENKKRLLIEQIEGEINDKRIYAIGKTEQAMFSGSPAGIERYGSVENARALTNEETVMALGNLLEKAFVRVNVVSASDPTPVFDKIKQYFSNIPRKVEKKNLSVFHKTVEKTHFVEENMDVTQGKLCMGFSLDCGKTREDNAKAIIFVDMFGGGPYSKLFANVREKQSLCYYCAARYNARKSTFMVDSGILTENRQKAFDGIMAQLEEMKNGNFTNEDLDASKMALIDSVRTIDDLAANIDSWYAMRTYDEGETTSKYIDMLEKVTLDDIKSIAKTVTLDTVYFLGKLKGDA